MYDSATTLRLMVITNPKATVPNILNFSDDIDLLCVAGNGQTRKYRSHRVGEHIAQQVNLIAQSGMV